MRGATHLVGMAFVSGFLGLCFGTVFIYSDCFICWFAARGCCARESPGTLNAGQAWKIDMEMNWDNFALIPVIK